MELTIDGKVYIFNFGIGFVREINPTKKQKENGIEQDVGLNYAVASIIDGDVLGLVDLLYLANKGQELRVTKAALEAYVDDCEDIDGLFAMVLDFLRSRNATKKVAEKMIEAVEQEKAKRAQTA